jgi:hypothetical protein
VFSYDFKRCDRFTKLATSSILAVEVGQETRQIAMHMVLAGLRRKNLLIGHDELAQPVQHGAEHVGRNEAVPQ